MDFYLIVASLITIGLGINVVLYLVKSPMVNYFFVALLVLLIGEWLNFISFNNSLIINQLAIVLSPVFLGPILYLFLQLERNKTITTKSIFFHLILPVIITFINLYNFNVGEDIATSIGLNLIIATINLIYGIVVLILIILKMNQNAIHRINNVLVLFTSLMVIYVLISSIVSFTTALYFTDDLELVNLSVNAPRMFEDRIRFWLLLITSLLGLLYGIFNLKTSNE